MYLSFVVLLDIEPKSASHRAGADFFFTYEQKSLGISMDIYLWKHKNSYRRVLIVKSRAFLGNSSLLFPA